MQRIPRRAENGWRTMLTLTSSSVAQAGDTNACVKFSLMTNKVCCLLRSGTSSFNSSPHFLSTHTHISLFICKGPIPKGLPDSKTDPCWRPYLQKDLKAEVRWRQGKEECEGCSPTHCTHPQNRSKTQHLYKQPVRGTERVTQQLRAQMLNLMHHLVTKQTSLCKQIWLFEWCLKLILQS